MDISRYGVFGSAASQILESGRDVRAENGIEPNYVGEPLRIIHFFAPAINSISSSKLTKR